MSPLLAFPSSSGSKVDPVPALNLVPSQKSDPSESKTEKQNSSILPGTSLVTCSSSTSHLTLVSLTSLVIVKALTKPQALIKLLIICWTSSITFTKHGPPSSKLLCTSLVNRSVVTMSQPSPEKSSSTKPGPSQLELNWKDSVSATDGLIPWTKWISTTLSYGQSVLSTPSSETYAHGSKLTPLSTCTMVITKT